MSQNYFTIPFSAISPADLRVLLKLLSKKMPRLIRAVNEIDSLNWVSFGVRDEKTILFSFQYDGNKDLLIPELILLAGNVFDSIFRHTLNPPPIPISNNKTSFMEWINRVATRTWSPLTVHPDLSYTKAASVSPFVNVAGKHLSFERAKPLIPYLN